MRILRVLLPVLVFGVMAFMPHQAAAATATFFGPIVPPECHCDSTQSAPDLGCVLQVIENLMNFAISIGVIIFVLVAAYAGLLWMTSPVNPHNREMGRSILINAVIGLLITLSAWLMVDFIMKTLYNGQFGPWNAILGQGNACIAIVPPPAGTGTTGSNNGGVTTSPGGQQTGNSQTEQAVRNNLLSVDITVNKAACPNNVRFQDVSGGCTTVSGLSTNTVNQAKNIAQTCGGYQITGGNELGHSEGAQSHTSGQKFDASTSLTSCIRSHTTSRTPTFGAEQRTDSCGNIYTRETNPNHWDIYVAGVCPLGN